MTVEQTDILGVLKVERDSWRATAERYAARLAEVERERDTKEAAGLQDTAALIAIHDCARCELCEEHR